MINNIIKTVIIFTLFIEQAYAYVDPGSGLLILQGLLAVVVMLLMMIKHPIVTMRKLFNLVLSKIFGRK